MEKEFLIKLPIELMAQLKADALRRGISMKFLLATIISEWINK